MSDELRYQIGDRVSAKSAGAEMGTVKSVDRINRSITVEYTQKFNGKESTRERTFPENQLFNQTELNENLGKELLKTVNEELKNGASINPERAYEDAYKNGTLTQKVGNGIGLVNTHLEQLKKDGLVTEEKGNYKLADGADPKQLDHIKVQTDMNGLAAKNASGAMKQELGARIDSWIMQATDVKAMGSGWKDFKSTYDSITQSAKQHANYFYDHNSKEFAALDMIVTEVFAATYSAAAVTAKWGAKNLGRAAYNLAKAVFGNSQNKTTNKANEHKINLNMQKLQEVKNANLLAEKAYEKFHEDAQQSRSEMQSLMRKQPTREQAQREKFERGESIWNSKEGQKVIAESKQGKKISAKAEAKTKLEQKSKKKLEPKIAKPAQKSNTASFTKDLLALKADYQKDLKALNSKYDMLLDKLEKKHEQAQKKEETKELSASKDKEKKESKTR
jgi:hypothetical protein